MEQKGYYHTDNISFPIFFTNKIKRVKGKRHCHILAGNIHRIEEKIEEEETQYRVVRISTYFCNIEKEWKQYNKGTQKLKSLIIPPL